MSVTKTLPKQIIQFKTSTSLVSLNERTIKVIASDDSPIDRFSWQKWEPYQLIVSHEKEAVNLDRVNNGVCLFFDGHPGMFSNSARLGKVINAEIVNKQLIATVKLSRNDEADKYLKEVEDGTQPGNSIGFSITQLETVKKAVYKTEEDENGYERKYLVSPAVMKAVKWELQELSAVDIPANPKTGSLSAEEREQFSKLPKNLVQFSGDNDDLDLLSNDIKADSETLDKQNKEEPKNMTTPSIQTQLADENRDLKLQLSALQSELKDYETKVTLGTLETDYYKARLKGLTLFAVDNKLTEDEYNIYFSADPQIDLDRLKASEPDDSKIELKSIQFSLKRSELKKPIERLATEKDKAIVSNDALQSKKATSLSETQFEDERARQEKEAEAYMTKKYSK